MAQHFDTRISLGNMIVVAVEENYKRLFYIYMNLSFFKLFFHLGCYILWSRVFCPIQWVLFGYPFKIYYCVHIVIFPGGSDGGPPALLQCRRPGFNPWVRKVSWRRKWQPTPVFLPGKSHGRRNWLGYSPWGRKESDTTERLHSLTHCVHVHTVLISVVLSCLRYSR